MKFIKILLLLLIANTGYSQYPKVGGTKRPLKTDLNTVLGTGVIGDSLRVDTSVIATKTDLFNVSVDTVAEIATKYDLTQIEDSIFLHPYLRNSYAASKNESEIIDIFYLGDSRAAQGRTSEALRKRLKKYGYAGAGVIPYWASNHSSLWNFTFIGTTTLDNSGAALFSTIGTALEFSASDEIVISSNSNLAEFDEIDIFYLKEGTSTTIDIDIDGTITTLTTLTGSNEVQKFTVSAASLAQHTITITNTGANTANVFEIVANNSTATNGIRLHSIGNGGQTTALQYNLRNNSYLYADIQPELVISKLGANDLAFNNEVQTAIYLDSVFTAAQRHGAKDILILGETDNTITPILGLPINYNIEFQSVANANNWAWLNMFDIVPDWGEFRSLGFAGVGDDVHENIAGGSYMANWIYSFLQTGKLETSVNGGSGIINAGTIKKVGYYSATEEISSSDVMSEETNGMRIQVAGNDATKIGLKITGGNNGTQLLSLSSTQVAFPYSTGNNYSHRLVSKHTGIGNGLHFYTHKTGIDGTTALGTHPILSLVHDGAGKVGINIDNATLPAAGLHVNGVLRLSGAFYAESNLAGNNGQYLKSLGTGGPPIWEDITTQLDTTYAKLGGNVALLNTFKLGTKDGNTVSLITQNINRFTVFTGGSLRMDNYGTGLQTGTPTAILAVESDGDVIEVDLASGMDAVVSDRSYVDNTAALVDLVSGQVYYNTTSSTFVVLP